MTVCTMTIKDRKTGEYSKEFGIGHFWDLISDDFEKKHQDKEVVRIEGVGTIIAKKLGLDCDEKKVIISEAIDLFVTDEWEKYGKNKSTNATQKRIQLAVSMIEEITAGNTSGECKNAIHISG